MKKDAKYIYPALELAIFRSRNRYGTVATAIGTTTRAVHNKRYGATDWKLGEMLAVRELVAPEMTLDELFRREEVRPNGQV